MEVNVNLAGQITRSLWDTGCSITYCDREAVPANLRQRIESPRTTTARTANGSRITFDRSIQLPIIIQRSKVYHTIHVTHGRNCPAPLIIGTDLQTKLTLSGRITTDYNKRCLELDNGEQLDFVNAIGCFNAMLDEAAERKAAEPLIARVAVDTTLPPRTDNLAKGVILEGADPNKTYIVEQKQHRFTMKVGKVLVKPDADGTIPLRLLNMGNNSITIPKGATVAYVTEATVHKPNNEASKAEDSDFDATDQELADILEQPTEDWVEQVEKLDLSKTVLNHQQRKQLRRLLLRKAKAFLHKGRRLGRYTGSVRHRIRLIEGTKPIARRAHRTPLALQDAMLKELQKLIDQDLIRLSDSPFAAPTLLLKKKDGSYRFVVDYRAINQHIAPQQYVLANIQTLVDICGGRKLFSTMDYSQAYHQIPVAEEDIPLKAFITEFGLFEWTVCPYGMVNSGETFSKMMKELARQMSFRILCFVDDVIIASDSVDRHLHDLEEFLTVVENNNLTVNLAKCVFARGEINYLGLVISHEGTRPDPGKVKAILETSRPTDMTAMRRFLGMVNYLRRHIRNCAQILRPLNDICKGERLGEWGPSQEAAFTEIKRCLTTAPVLASPRIGVPYVLETDASKQGLGYCLLQPDEEGVNHVICYGSRKTTKHEEKKDPCVLVALAVRWSLDQVAPYIVGGPTTTVRTDNTAVTALLTKEDRTVTSQMNKFHLALQAYPIKLEHRAGKTNYVADYLSRYPTDHQPQATKQATAQAQQANAITSDDLRLTASRIRAEQQRDDCIKANYDELTRKPRRGQQLASAPTGASSNFSVIKYNVHYQATAADKPRIYLPQRLRESAIRELHEDAFSGGHLGITKCTEKVRQRFYWPHLPEEVAQIITSCEKCQLRKAPPAAVSKEPLHKWPTPQWPMQRIHIDIYGALPLTAKRHRYALTSVCALTKFVVMVPLRNQTFDDVKDALLSHAFSKYGVPSYIASDQGSQFMGSQFAEFSKEYGFEHLAISAHHQSANAQAERFHATIGKMIATYSNENGTNWDIHLPLLTMALNSSVHRIISNSAFWTMFGREANLPIDLRTHAFQGERFGRPEGDRPGMSGTDNNFLQEQQARMANLRKAWKHVQSLIEDKGEIRDAYRDERVRAKNHQLQEGDLVLKRKAEETIKHKFDSRYDGPYRIKSVNPPNVVIQRLHEGSKPFAVHVDQVKRFKTTISLPVYTEEATANAIQVPDEEAAGPPQHAQANGHWREIPVVALVYTTAETEGRSQVLGLDLDETIVRTKSGGIFAENIDDWKWYNSAVPDVIRALYSAGFKVCIFTNQKGIQLGIVKPEDFKHKAESVCNAIGVAMQVFASVGDSRYRKPNVGLWLLMEKEENESIPVNRSRCIFVGDAAGRPATATKPADHSDSDKLFASNLGVSFATPEQPLRHIRYKATDSHRSLAMESHRTQAMDGQQPILMQNSKDYRLLAR